MGVGLTAKLTAALTAVLSATALSHSLQQLHVCETQQHVHASHPQCANAARFASSPRSKFARGGGRGKVGDAIKSSFVMPSSSTCGTFAGGGVTRSSIGSHHRAGGSVNL